MTPPFPHVSREPDRVLSTPPHTQLIKSGMGVMPARPSINVGSAYHWSGQSKGATGTELGKVDAPLAKPRFGRPPVRRFDKGLFDTLSTTKFVV